jgi:hypothetical protein
VISNATELEITRITGVSDGAELLVLDEWISNSELLTHVAERLQRVQERRA